MFTRDSKILSHRLTTPLTSVANAVGDVFKPTYNQIIKALFANNEQGFAYDPNDLTTMFQDAAETVPVTGVGQAVGLMLDKSKGLVVGNELVTNSNFDSDTAWVKAATVTISGGNAILNNSTGNPALSQNVGLVADRWYDVTFIVSEMTVGSIVFRSYGTVGNDAILNASTSGTYNLKMKARSDTTGLIGFSASSTSAKIDRVSVREIAGNHAYQTTSAARPLLKQRSSELVINGDFGNGITGWTQSGTATVTVSGGILTVQANGATSGVYQDFTVKPNTKYRLSLTVSALSRVAVYGNWAFSPLMGFATAGVLEFTPTSDKVRVYLYCNGTDVGTFDNVSLRKVVEDSYISNAISFDTIDDKLTTTLSAQLTGCTVVRSVPNVGTQILTGQTIPTTYNDNTDHCGLIVINRVLTATETSQITKLFNKAAGV